MLTPTGFDPARDIVAITVNLRPHGYAYEYNPLWDPEKAPEDEPCVLARQPFADHHRQLDAAYAYTDAAIGPAISRRARAGRDLGRAHECRA